jgi:hypothetical protein
MGRSLVVAERDKLKIPKNTIQYSLAKRIAIFTDIKAGIPYAEICVRHDVGKGTVSRISKDQQLQEMLDPRILELRKKHLAGLNYYVADISLSSITVGDVQKLNALQRGILAATNVDKARLLEGQSTENISVRGTVEHYESELSDIKARKEALFAAMQSKAQAQPEC